MDSRRLVKEVRLAMEVPEEEALFCDEEDEGAAYSALVEVEG